MITNNYFHSKSLNGTGIVSADMFTFCPDNPVQGQVEKYSRRGRGIQLSDGTFEFVPEKSRRSKTELIKKMAHGRVSRLKDGSILLTVRVSNDENLRVCDVIAFEACEGAMAVMNFLREEK